jgi:putative heme-binding domain-containing protein
MGWHYYLPLHDLARNPNLAVKSVREVIDNDKQVFPISPPMRRFNWAEATNTLTSGCSPMPYRDVLLGDDGKDVMFICEPANNLVHREVLNYTDMTVTSTRHPGDKDSEFIASEDNWFRPTMARTGPDGALYVVDMYRLVLEHPEWIPADITKGLDLRAGEDKGRIYRIAKSGTAGPAWPDLSDAVQGLQSSNGWVRDAAMRRIIEAQDKSAIDPLKPLARSAAKPAVQIQALWTLTLLHALDGATLDAALASPDKFVRVNALRCAVQAALVPSGLDKLLHDPAPQVRFALALAAGDLPKAERVQIITALARAEGDDARMLTAIRSSMAGIEADLTDDTRKLIASKVKKGGKPAANAPAIPVIINNNPDRQKVVKQYAVTATLAGDAKRGHLFYTAICAVCHKLKGEGNEIGPDLGTIASKPLDQLIESILDPSRAVEQRYTVQTVTTKDGKDHIGLIIEENGNNITLRSGTATELILVKDISKRVGTSKSLMPDGMENLLKPQDVADVIAWIRAVK